MLDTATQATRLRDVLESEGPLHRALGILNAMAMAFEAFGEGESEADSLDALTVLTHRARDEVAEAYRHVKSEGSAND
jgi:hypothetical protein